MTLHYVSDDILKKSLQEFSEGNHFSLFKLVLENLYDKTDVLGEPKFIINTLKNTQNFNDKNYLTELLVDSSIDFSKEYEEKDPLILNRYNHFWNNRAPNPAPLLFHVAPYLYDEQFEKIFKIRSIYKISDYNNANLLAETLITRLFEKGYEKSIISFKEEFYLYNKLEKYERKFFPGAKEEQSLEEYIWESVLKNPSLLYPYSLLTYNGLEGLCERWVTHHLDSENIDNSLIHKFLNTAFEHLEKEQKEQIIPYMLYKTENLDLFNTALKKYGCENLSSYQPTKSPVWIRASEHKNKKIYKKFLRNGVDLFDHNQQVNSTFLGVMLDGLAKRDLKEAFSSQKIDYKLFVRKLFDYRTDDAGKVFTNFSLLISANENYVTDNLNLKIEDLEYYSVRFKPERYNTFNAKDKIELMNDVVEKTFLANCYIPKDIYYSKYKEQKVINFNLYMANDYSPREGIYIIDEHLSLLEIFDFNKYDYRAKYFEIVKQMFDCYATPRIDVNSDIYKTYMKIIDYVATDKTLDWESIKAILESEKIEKIQNRDEFTEGGSNLYNYLHKVTLSHLLKQTNKLESKKLKI